MHVISHKPFNEAIKRFPPYEDALIDLLNLLEKTAFSDPGEMKRYIPSLDNFKYRDKWWVINIAGNHLRLIAYIDFRLQKCFIKHIVTHNEYDRLTTWYRSHKNENPSHSSRRLGQF
ncbi:cytoplasmic protein [Escherichia sp. E4930]|uniref:type II toxin-antitoxin system HigB family toxin n=1 Tax=Escherichia sp. E4930 TaxID=2044468 RepID=UPI00107FD107|nr:type II toxin-antitoxin system HigB family toxin [Escherichia sp. E4930]TGB66492.1 cytoplasmic protein [Escherichia sp. E4930]TLU80927.1 cytoplasmic protein [Escherichia sp. E4930]